jgi:serine/threonine protein kinase
LRKILGDLGQSPNALDEDGRWLVADLERLKASTAGACPAISGTRDVESVPDQILTGDSSVVRLAVDSKANPIAVKTAKNPGRAELIRREALILQNLKHPLVLELRGPVSRESIATAYAWRGSLAECRWRGPNRTAKAKIVAGIALAMRAVHARRVVYRDLKPQNILLDWDWSVRIAGFGRSTAPGVPERRSPASPEALWGWCSNDSRYLAPECYDGTFLPASDVFAFGLILFEILAGFPAFSARLGRYKILRSVVEGERPEIPGSVAAGARELIEDCWAHEPDDRPTFAAIVDRLVGMEFKVTAGVNRVKLRAFVKRIEEWEGEHWDD